MPRLLPSMRKECYVLFNYFIGFSMMLLGCESRRSWWTGEHNGSQWERQIPEVIRTWAILCVHENSGLLCACFYWERCFQLCVWCMTQPLVGVHACPSQLGAAHREPLWAPHVLGRALGRQWFTSRNKCFARVGLRRDYLLKHGGSHLNCFCNFGVTDFHASLSFNSGAFILWQVKLVRLMVNKDSAELG